MEYVASTCQEAVIEPWHLPEALMTEPGTTPPIARAVEKEASAFRPLGTEIRELERLRMTEALRVTGGVKTRAAELLSMPLRTFTGKLKQYALTLHANPRRGKK